MRTRESLKFRGGAGVVWQVALVIAAWLYLGSLHWNNDGLWYQGDAPRHAANGLFWKDFLLSGSLDLKRYALSYYARYPAINPTAYPPAFYLLEGTLFGLIRPSPYLAKGLVLLFALIAALYAIAWLRRWVAEEAGWGGGLLLLLPGTVLWSHAIMLNVPAMTLGLGALYHARRWLESSTSGVSPHIYVAAALTVLAVFTYFTAGVVVLVILAWLVSFHAKLLCRFATLLAGVGCLILLLPVVLVGIYWLPVHMSGGIPTVEYLLRISTWTYYFQHGNELSNLHLIVLAAVGVCGGMFSRRWRRETTYLLIWLGVIYAFFSCLVAKEGRYVLLLGPPLTFLCLIAIFSVAGWISKVAQAGAEAIKLLVLIATAGLLAIQTWLAGQVHVPSIPGFAEVAAFVEHAVPAEPVLYDGYFDGLFTFYVQAGDPNYRRRVVLGSKLLYPSAWVPGWRQGQSASTQQEVLEALRTRSGSRWLIVEMSAFSQPVEAARLLRETVNGPEFELVKSFPIHFSGIDRLDLYRLLLPVQQQDEVDLPFPILGDGAHYRVKPIELRGPANDDVR